MDMIILIGLQASGESSFCKRFAETHEIISKDLFPNAKYLQRRQMKAIEAALAARRSVAIDNTNPAVEDRKPLIDAARVAGADVIGYYFESKVEDCLARNSQREGHARVPDVALFSTIKRLERPSPAEGFDRLYYVCLKDGAFDISPWMEDLPR